MKLQTKHDIFNFVAILVILAVALIDPRVALGIVVALLVGYVAWEWLAVHRAAQRLPQQGPGTFPSPDRR